MHQRDSKRFHHLLEEIECLGLAPSRELAICAATLKSGGTKCGEVLDDDKVNWITPPNRFVDPVKVFGSFPVLLVGRRRCQTYSESFRQNGVGQLFGSLLAEFLQHFERTWCDVWNYGIGKPLGWLAELAPRELRSALGELAKPLHLFDPIERETTHSAKFQSSAGRFVDFTQLPKTCFRYCPRPTLAPVSNDAIHEHGDGGAKFGKLCFGDGAQFREEGGVDFSW